MKNIRNSVNASFLANLPRLAELGNAGFRKLVMQAAVQEFSISVASAATHYNFSLKQARAADPKSVAGLGRPEGKNNGGRKVSKPVTVIKVKTGEVVVENISRAKADALITEATAKRKAKLMIRVEQEALLEPLPAIMLDELAQTPEAVHQAVGEIAAHLDADAAVTA